MPVAVGSLVSIVTAVVPILVAQLVLLLLWCGGGARQRSSTPAGRGETSHYLSANQRPEIYQLCSTYLPALAPPTSGVWNSVGGALVSMATAPSAERMEVVRRLLPWSPGLWAGPDGGWVCLRGRMGGGATSSLQVMAVFSSQDRGDAGTGGQTGQ